MIRLIHTGASGRPSSKNVNLQADRRDAMVIPRARAQAQRRDDGPLWCPDIEFEKLVAVAVGQLSAKQPQGAIDRGSHLVPLSRGRAAISPQIVRH